MRSPAGKLLFPSAPKVRASNPSLEPTGAFWEGSRQLFRNIVPGLISRPKPSRLGFVPNEGKHVVRQLSFSVP